MHHRFWEISGEFSALFSYKNIYLADHRRSSSFSALMTDNEKKQSETERSFVWLINYPLFSRAFNKIVMEMTLITNLFRSNKFVHSYVFHFVTKSESGEETHVMPEEVNRNSDQSNQPATGELITVATHSDAM